jgi:hypothetical protein
MTTRDYLNMVNKAACCSPPTLQNTYDLALKCIESHMDGVFVECGVYAGAQIGAMWRSMVDTGNRRMMHLFDSFQGCPKAGPKDSEEWQSEDPGKACSSRENTENFLNQWWVDARYTTFHEGWFEDTVPRFATYNGTFEWCEESDRWVSSGEFSPTHPIALLRLDGDLYESTKVCLEYLYPLVVPGGFVVIDDYALKGCHDAVHEYFGDDLPELIKIEGGGGPVWFQK